jgi:hypothetical protein
MPVLKAPINLRVNKPESDDPSILERVEEPIGIILALGFLEGDELGFGQHEPILPSCALLASSALSRFFMVSRSRRSHTQRPPAGDGSRRRS